MEAPHVVVIGGSAGALRALLEIVRHLPPDFPAAVLVVVHLSPDHPSRLPQLLNGAGPLGARTARSGDLLEPGRLYVAPPDHHLLVQGGTLHLSRGPRENRARPSIDVLFRSAAYARAPAVTGVLLSGMLDDGTSGLWTIKHLGGYAVVQHPEEADYPSMPLSAVQRVEVDDILPAREIGPQLVRQVAQAVGGHRETGIMTEHERHRLELELRVAAEDNAFEGGILNLGPMSTFTCPECHGVMVKLEEGGAIRFRCHTGHAFTPAALLSDLRESVEETLWTSVRALDENVMLLDHLAKHFAEAGDPVQGEVFRQEAAAVKERSHTVRGVAMQARERPQLQAAPRAGVGDEVQG